MRALTSVVVAFVLSTSLFAAEQIRPETGPAADDVPLRDWSVDYSFHNISSDTPSRGALRAATDALPSATTHFIAINPCRVVDTRGATGTFGGPFFSAGQTRTFTIPAGPCAGIPVATAYSLNFTIVNYDATLGPSGFVTAFPSGTTRPTVSTVNFGNGSNAVANAAVVAASATGAIDVFSSGATHLIVDINGYFVEGPPSKFRAALRTSRYGALPYTANFTSTGGTLMIMVSGSGYTSAPGLFRFTIKLDNVQRGESWAYTNETASHKTTVPITLFVGAAAGSHSILLESGPASGTTVQAMQSDSNDTFEVTILELPF